MARSVALSCALAIACCQLNSALPGPRTNPRYLALSFTCIAPQPGPALLSFLTTSASPSSPSGMTTTFFRLSRSPESDPKRLKMFTRLGRACRRSATTTARSSAYALCRIPSKDLSNLRRRRSAARAKRSGLSGHPWRMPVVMLKPSREVPPSASRHPWPR